MQDLNLASENRVCMQVKANLLQMVTTKINRIWVYFSTDEG